MLTVRETMALRLAAAPHKYPAVREETALIELGLTPTRFWAMVDRALKKPEAVAVLPMETRRLMRLRERRRMARVPIHTKPHSATLNRTQTVGQKGL